MSDKPILTARQQQIFDFLKEKIMTRGYGPTIREIGAFCGISSPNGVLCHLKALEKKGLITRETGLSHTIRVTSLPSQSSLATVGQLGSEDPMKALDRGAIVDFATLFDHSTNFALTVTGDALAGHHIVDGDTVVLTRASKASSGDIVLANVEGQDPVLRVYSKNGSQFRLEGTGKTKPIPANRATIVGKVVGVIRWV